MLRSNAPVQWWRVATSTATNCWAVAGARSTHIGLCGSYSPSELCRRCMDVPFDHRDLQGVVHDKTRDHRIGENRERLPPG